MAVRELFPASEASWRVPTLLLFSGSGMAFGGWLAGAIYDYAGFYAIAFGTGILFNLVHLALIGVLVWRQRLRTILGPRLRRLMTSGTRRQSRKRRCFTPGRCFGRWLPGCPAALSPTICCAAPEASRPRDRS
jgi:MFS family permease